MVKKAEYFAEINGLDLAECAPTISSEGVIYPKEYRDAILAIDDEDTAFVLWKHKATVPTFVTMRKARVWLVRNSLLDTVNAAVDSLGQEAIETWNTSQECQRTNPILNAVLDGIGYTELEKDQMFIDADKL